MELAQYKNAARIIMERIDAATQDLQRAEMSGCSVEYDELVYEIRDFLSDESVLSDIAAGIS